MKTTTKIVATQRHRQTLEEIATRGHMSVQILAQIFKVSEMTMRRDLDFLAEKGLIKRTHGGAATLESSLVNIDFVEPEIYTRANTNHVEKKLIAKVAATFVSEGQTIALDIGSSTLELAKEIHNRRVNIHTSSLNIARYLNQSLANVYMPGGKIFGTEPSMVGARSVDYFNQLCFDVFFIGASGMSEEGFFDYSLEDTEIKSALIDKSRKKIVLLDSSKFNRMSVVKVCSFKQIDVLITDSPPPENLREILDESKVEILLVNS